MVRLNTCLAVFKNKHLLLLLIVITSVDLSAQTREELEQERQRIQQEISLTSQLLEETKKSAEINLNQLIILNNQISQRENLLKNINNKISFINRQINGLSEEIKVLNNDLKELKESYANMIQHAHKNRNENHRLMFLFSSRDFNQAYMRMKYMQQYARDRQLQAQKIEKTAETLDQQIAELESSKKEQQQLLAEQRTEIETLSSEKEEQNSTVLELRRRERTLMRQLERHEKEAEELSKSIQRVIEEERRRAAEKARAEGRDAPSTVFELTPEEQIISDNFFENKGNLPWPSERGVITRTFGEQPHPVLPGIRISSDGINISTAEGAEARAVFEGTVVRVFSVPGGNNAVIIRHGEYLTVYSNLSDVTVRNGQRVKIRQKIGVISTNPRDMKTELHLQVWKDTQKLNPAEWIARR